MYGAKYSDAVSPTESKQEGIRLKKALMVTTTSTYANKAKDILKANGIKAEVRKVQGGTAAGCLFGIAVGVNDAARAGALLERENIKIISVREVPS